jgi:hypothetical protein
MSGLGATGSPNLPANFATLSSSQLVTLAAQINTTLIALNAQIGNAPAGQSTTDLQNQQNLWQAYYNAVMAKLAVVQNDPNANQSLLNSIAQVDQKTQGMNNANSIITAFAQLVVSVAAKT